MKPVTFASVFVLSDDVAKAPSSDPAAGVPVHRLYEQLKLMEYQVQRMDSENGSLRARVEALKEERARLQEEHDRPSTDEFDKTGYVWRRTSDGGRVGPYCPIHRDVLLMQVDDRWMGMYCSECGAVIPDQTL